MKKYDSSHFIVCRAAAGSGKTYTLVRHYIELAFDAAPEELPRRFGRILAITFTNKAANEMKERILSELDQMSRLGTGCDMGSDIAKHMAMDDATLKSYAQTVLQAILHNYSDFAVSTIDSFVSHIVHTFAHDLNLPMNFDVNIDHSELIENAVNRLMAMVGDNGQEELTEVLCEFAEHQMEEDRSYMIERQLAKLAEELFKEEAPQYLAALSKVTPTEFRAMHKEMLDKNRAYEKKMRELGQKGVDIITKHNLKIEDFYQKGKGAGAYFHKVAKGTFDAPKSTVTDFLEGDKLGNGPADKLREAKAELVVVHNDIETLRAKEERLYNTRKLLMKDLYSMAVLNQLNQLVEDYSNENGIVHISEFNKRIAEVVEKEPMPFIYERIGTHYTNYLIDEFQDTSRMQWQNLIPLVANSISTGHTSLVVGDGKQAIYRFRKGDVDQFLKLPETDNEFHGQLLKDPYVADPQRLETNFRSCQEVVDFNNKFFTWVLQNRYSAHAELQEIYISPKQLAKGQDPNLPDLVQKHKKEGGYVQAGFWNLGGQTKDYEPMWKAMLEDIRRQVDEKGYAYRDITILARSNTTLTLVSDYLTANGVPVVSSESFLLNQSRTVMMLRSLFQYLVDGNDRVAAMRVALYMQGLGLLKEGPWDTQVFMAKDDKQPQPRLLERIVETMRKDEQMTLDCDRLRSMALYDCCEEAIRMLGLAGTDNAYTATLLNVIARYGNTHRQDWGEFIEWFDKEQKNLSTSTSADLDAVKLMTIHKAKGLESPIVMYPVLNNKKFPPRLWTEVDPALETNLPIGLIEPTGEVSTLFDPLRDEENLKVEMDNLNVLYVALTRPKEKLMLYCDAPSKGNLTAYTNLLHDYLKNADQPMGDDDRWSSGTDNVKKKKSEEKTGDTAVPLAGISFPGWTDRITIAEQANEMMGQFDEAAVRRGNQMHAILSLMRSSDDCGNALKEYIGQHPEEAEDAPALEAQLQQMMQQESTSRFFKPGLECKNECSLVWKGKVLRPDRIVLAEGETWVVDFKTGKPTEKHHEQVKDYCDAIRSMGYPEVKGFLLYIGTECCQVTTV